MASNEKAVAKKDDNKPAKKSEKKAFKDWKLIRYFREMFGEVKRLTWLTGKELLSHTVAVFVFVAAMAIVIYALDLGFSAGMSALERIPIG